MVQMIISAPGEQPLPAVAWNYEEVKSEVEASAPGPARLPPP